MLHSFRAPISPKCVCVCVFPPDNQTLQILNPRSTNPEQALHERIRARAALRRVGARANVPSTDLRHGALPHFAGWRDKANPSSSALARISIRRTWLVPAPGLLQLRKHLIFGSHNAPVSYCTESVQQNIANEGRAQADFGFVGGRAENQFNPMVGKVRRNANADNVGRTATLNRALVHQPRRNVFSTRWKWGSS